MKMYNLFIDGGTTYTRFTLMDQETIVAREEYKIGAGDAAHPEENEELESMVGRVICNMQQTHGCRIEEIYASGMITSNIGICEVPYVKAPADVSDLARGMMMKQINTQDGWKTVCFVPGISFSNKDGYVMDVMRGEEVEIIGGLKQYNMTGNVMFVHFGSHNKMIYCQEQKICESVTTISGELVWAVLNETILRSSALACEDESQMDDDFIRLGYQNACRVGLSRALFMARILHTQEGAGGRQITSYIYGALTCEDIKAFSELLKKKADHFILYGRSCFIRAFSVCLKLYDSGIRGEMVKMTFDGSEGLSVQGMGLIAKQSRLEKEKEGVI